VPLFFRASIASCISVTRAWGVSGWTHFRNSLPRTRTDTLLHLRQAHLCRRRGAASTLFVRRYSVQGDAGVLTKEIADTIARVLDELYTIEHSLPPGALISVIYLPSALALARTLVLDACVTDSMLAFACSFLVRVNPGSGAPHRLALSHG
jgi:hypothetical protein